MTYASYKHATGAAKLMRTVAGMWPKKTFAVGIDRQFRYVVKLIDPINGKCLGYVGRIHRNREH